MNELENAIADTFIKCLPDLAEMIRRAKAAGGEKSEVVRRVTRFASKEMLPTILIAVDKIWSE